MTEPIDFYFDFSSSYSYIGQHRLQDLAAMHGREIRWKPIALGAIFKSIGSGPHSPETSKGSYVWKDVERVDRCSQSAAVTDLDSLRRL